MNAAIRRQYLEVIPDPSMKGPVVTSAFFHVVLFALTMVGLPFVAQEHVVSTPISIEIVEVDKITQTDKPPAPKVEAEKPKEEKLEPPPIEKPAPPQMITEAPPVLEKPKPPEKKAEVEKPKPKPVKPPEKTEEKKQEKDFTTLLKNLTPDTPDETQPSETANSDSSSMESIIAQLGDRLTMSEEDSIRQQITPCWNVPAGAKFAEELVVEVRVFMNRDGSIRDTSILDSGRYNRDTHFRAAADAAERALRNPRCTPLKYPPEKYEQMKAFVFRFDPSDML